MNEKPFVEMFDKEAKEKDSRRHKAEILKNIATPMEQLLVKRNAGRIEVDMDQVEIYFMLTGLAIENLVKGILIERIPSLIKKGKMVDPDKIFIIHDLDILIKDNKIIELDSAKEVLLKKLSYNVKHGKYPVPLKRDDNFKEISPQIYSTVSGLMYPQDIDLSNEIYKSLLDLYS